MLNKLFKTSLVLIILLLVISSLNISNQAINSLTMEKKGPVFALKIVGQDLNVSLLSKSYNYSGDKFKAGIISLGKNPRLIYDKATNHLHKIWEIYQVIFRDNYDLT